MNIFREQITELRYQVYAEITRILNTQPDKTITYSWGCECLSVSNGYEEFQIDVKKVSIVGGRVLIYNADDEYSDETYTLDDITTLDSVVSLLELLMDGAK